MSNLDRTDLLAFLRSRPGESSTDRLASDMRRTRERTRAALRSLQATGHIGYDSNYGVWLHGRERMGRKR